ncbi:tripartite tricarboxylate transporter TctB family protein [Clostridium sp. AM58-1XD]|uniref:tripartite tricarboxylate transporter TctB family protein n=1 Tax=Clostridium sp. AM58-1XD TaxID=2292307 RepID=UPI000E47FBBA|nr:tripartite tricarboxylate transporter TctB family protein [Clostridium sp. AM58-1XD]RGZ01203.1 tripartite tricarboxylate transporter TctB family protein [Clostridium sp. AM58-1XD]
MKFMVKVPAHIYEKAAAAMIVGLGIMMKIYSYTAGWYESSSSRINNPAFFPDMTAYALIVIGVVIFINSFFTKKEEEIEVNLRGILMVAIWMAYALLMPVTGFVAGGIAVIAVSMIIWGEKKKITVATVSVLAPVIIYICLGKLMSVNFPKGILPF